MDLERLLETYESTILTAIRFQGLFRPLKPEDREDLLQEGRVAAMEALDTSREEITQKIRRAVSRGARRSYRKEQSLEEPSPFYREPLKDRISGVKGELEGGVIDNIELQLMMGFLEDNLSEPELETLNRLLAGDKGFFLRLGWDYEHLRQVPMEEVREKLDFLNRLLHEDDDVRPEVLLYSEILIGARKRFPRMFFSPDKIERSRTLTRFLVDRILDTDERTETGKLRHVTSQAFKDYGLDGMLFRIYDHSPYRAIADTFPKKFMPWELLRVGNGYWRGDNSRKNAIAATKWLVEERLGISIDEIPDNITWRSFKANGLDGMLQVVYQSSPYKAIEGAYPGRFKPWEFKEAPLKYWVGEEGRRHAIEATRWLIEEKLRIPIDEIPQKVKRRTFAQYGLVGMLQTVYANSPYKAINDAYPGRFKPREMGKAPQDYWHGEDGRRHALEAIDWLSDKTGKPVESLRKRDFVDNGLSGMLKQSGFISYRRAIEFYMNSNSF